MAAPGTRDNHEVPLRVAVAGGTGFLGSLVVQALRRAGDEAVVLSRRHGVDLVTGQGLDRALDGVEAVIDCTSGPSRRAEQAVAFFGTVARTLQSAAARAGARCVVTVSVIGADQMAGRPHYAGKLAQEEATRAGELPATILRTTQFHDFGGMLIARARRRRVLTVPIQPVQTVDSRTVAEQLARLAHGPDDGATVHLAGPQRLTLAAVVRRTARASGQRLLVVPTWRPGASERAARRGAALPPPNVVIDGPSFDDWLARLH